MRSLWLLLLAGCPSDDAVNARVLFLANDMVETELKLVEQEPEPF
jgi:hypothetical protein